MEILAQLFGTEARAKLIRLFVFNPDLSYSAAEASACAALKPGQAKATLDFLVKVGLLRKKSVTREISKKTSARRGKKGKKGAARAKKHKTRTVKEAAYSFNFRFPYGSPLADLMAAASIQADNRLTARLLPAGRIKLIIASGIFVRRPDSRLDLLVVGDDVDTDRLARIMKSLQADVGRDLSYSALTTADFEYRLGLHDRLVRDVLDFPHIVILDKIGLKTEK